MFSLKTKHWAAVNTPASTLITAVAAMVLLTVPHRVLADSCLEVDLNGATFAAVRDNTINEEEAVEFAFDGDIHTKWLDYAGGSASWVTVDIQAPYAVTTYGLVSANDEASRDPAAWILSASYDGGSTWVEIDRQDGIVFTAREQRQAFQINEAGSEYQLFRLNITSVFGSPEEELMQVAEIEFWAGSECHDPCCGVDCGDHGTCDSNTGTCSCEAHYSGDNCEVAETQWNEFSGRLLVNDQLVWYKSTTLEECQTRCSMDWTGTSTPCIGISFRHEDSYCYLYSDSDDNGPTLESDDDYTSYLAFV